MIRRIRFYHEIATDLLSIAQAILIYIAIAVPVILGTFLLGILCNRLFGVPRNKILITYHYLLRMTDALASLLDDFLTALIWLLRGLVIIAAELYMLLYWFVNAAYNDDPFWRWVSFCLLCWVITNTVPPSLRPDFAKKRSESQ